MRALGGPIAAAMFVCLNDRSDPASERRAPEAGFDYFMTQPMETAVLADVLDQAGARLAAAAAPWTGAGQGDPPEPAA